jgi:hypothetical protein
MTRKEATVHPKGAVTRYHIGIYGMPISWERKPKNAAEWFISSTGSIATWNWV